MPFGTADVLQALLRDGSAALEIVPADGSMRQYWSSKEAKLTG